MNRRTLLVPLVAGILATGCAGSSDDVVEVRSAIDGRAIADAGPRTPIELRPDQVSTLELEVRNDTGAPVEVGRVRLVGELLDLTFLTYDVRVGSTVDPGASRTIEVPLDFFDLERQASGYLRASVRTYDTDGQGLSSEPLVLDVRGDPTSTMAIFAGLLVLLTALSLGRNLRDHAKGLLPPNRFVRGLRFAMTGLGVGLVVSVASSILRVYALPTVGWVPITLAATAIGFGLGYAATGGVRDEDFDGDGEPDEDVVRDDDDQPVGIDEDGRWDDEVVEDEVGPDAPEAADAAR